jgi:carbon storage regulator CsrA
MEGFQVLVLSRRTKERLIITAPNGTRLEIQVADIRSRNVVRLAITAPKDYLIMREELLEEDKK